MARLQRWALRHYAQALSEAKFESWIYAGLIPGWRTDCFAYRRALEVCRSDAQSLSKPRFHITDIKLDLWLTSPEFRAGDIRADMLDAFRRTKRATLRRLRGSLSLFTKGSVSPRQLPTIQRQGAEEPNAPIQFGTLTDEELAAITSFMLTGNIDRPLRIGTHNVYPRDAIAALAARLGMAGFLGSAFPEFLSFVVSMMAGLDGTPDEIANSAERVLVESTLRQYYDARELFRRLARSIKQIERVLASSQVPPPHFEDHLNVTRAVIKAFKTPQWRFVGFISTLVITHRDLLAKAK